MIIITILSGYPGNKIPEVPIVNFDKLVHVGIYSVLSFLICFAYSQKNNSLVFNVLIVFFGIFYGGLMEFFQHFIFINRSGSWIDFFANTLGAIFGVIFFPVIVKLFDTKS